MSQQEITVQSGQGLWDSKQGIEEIKNMFGKNLTEGEFAMFLSIGKATGLNPFLKEIWAVKYGTGAASIFIGRDGYRRAAQDNPEYDFHMADAVYTGDNFSVNDGVVTHSYNMTDRGSLKGAYGIAKRKGSSKPCFIFVNLGEYMIEKSPIWASKPATMIKKVAEAQVLRMAFQKMFAATYDESEQWKAEAVEASKSTVKTADPVTGEIVSSKE